VQHRVEEQDVLEESLSSRRRREHRRAAERVADPQLDPARRMLRGERSRDVG